MQCELRRWRASIAANAISDWLFATAIVESAFIVSFVLLADLSNRLHLLLLISTMSCYSIVVLGLVALGAQFNRGIARVLKAVELSIDPDPRQ